MAGKDRKLPDLVARVKLQTAELDMLPKKAAEAGAGLRAGLKEGELGVAGLNTKLDGATLKLTRVGHGGGVAGKEVKAGAHEAEAGLINLERTAELVQGRLGRVAAEGAEMKGAFNLGGGSMVGGLALTAGLGGIAVAAEKAKEQAEKHEKAERLLEQAYQASGRSLEEAKPKLEAWLKAHEKAIPDVNQAREVLASFVRAGFDEEKQMEAIQIATDLAAIKHVDLATAGKAVELGMMGNGKALKELGIDLKELKNSDENAIKAQKDLDAATKGVDAATRAHDAASKNLALMQASLAGKHTLTAAEALRLKDAEDKVTLTAKDLKDAQGKVRDAQDEVNNSSSTATQVLKALSEKTTGGADSYTDMEKAQHKANAEWDRAASTLGPPLLEIQTGILDTATNLYEAMENFGKNDGWWKGLNDGLINIVRTGQHVADVIGSINRTVTDLTHGNIGGFAGDVSGLFGGGRASGGPVLPNSIYRVGEQGPETLVMGSSGGRVLADGGAAATAAGGMGADPDVLNRLDRIAGELAAIRTGSLAGAEAARMIAGA